MKRIILTWLALFLVTTGAFSQEMFKRVFKDGKFGYENPKGELVIDYQFDKAEYFTHLGVAKVEKDGQEFLLDGHLKLHEVAYEVEDLTKKTTALFLKGEKFEVFPMEILKHEQLEILIFVSWQYHATRFNYLPKQINRLKNLTILSLDRTPFVSLPQEITDLKYLRQLNLRDNFQLPLSEISRVFTNMEKGIWLTSVRNEINTNSPLLMIKYNGYMKKLPKELATFTTLERLDLPNHQLHGIYEGVEEGFWNCTSLKHLNISGNKLKSLPDGIQKMQNLTYLNVSNNHLSDLPDGIWSLKNVKELDIGHNPLGELPPQIGQLTNLTIFVAQNNDFKSIPTEIGQLKQLRHVELSGNQFTTLPTSIKNWRQLEYMKLGGYRILESLPKEIKYWKKLKTLTVLDGALKELPDEIVQLKKLEILEVKNGHLQSLPKNIGRLKRLKKVNFFGNYITELPASFYKLKELEEVNFSKNNLKNLSNDIQHFSKIKQLDLSGNYLQKLPKAIGKLNELELLHLEANELSEVPNTLKNLQQLKRLDLSYNQFETFPQEILALKKLETLWFHNNRISAIPEALNDLSNLRCHLDDNAITTLPVQFSIIELVLDGNPLDEKSLDWVETSENMSCEVVNEEDDEDDAEDYEFYRKYAKALEDYEKTYLPIQHTYDLAKLCQIACLDKNPKKVLQYIIDFERKEHISDDYQNVIKGFEMVAFVLNDDFEKAANIYETTKGQTISKNKNHWLFAPFREEMPVEMVYLKFIEKLEREGVTHPNFQKLKEILK